ncbi:MAG: gliding motility-associated C-terminal domain-containing protein [Bacteroidales bacterium]|nr:gliding motility-associated C-terminal domain-containing protein [Bacteroidales bacterium]
MISLCDCAVAQKNISGTVNGYSKVTAINPNTRTVTLSNGSIIKAMDTVLLIQMTGIQQLSGTITGTSAGLYEFHIVESVAGNTVTLKSTPGSFDTNELVQMVRVPSYKNATVAQGNTLTCQGWNWAAGTGGVLALMVDETLSLNGNIDVSGLGFNGGKAYTTAYTGLCSFNAGDGTDKADYPGTSNLAGYKGEGAVLKSYFEANPKGYGKAWNGGGGGNGKWSGGGGGANGNSAGNGDDQVCNVQGFDRSKGNYGDAVKYDEIDVSTRTFMGGGGGAGTGIGTAGGNGGGIVIIVAQKLVFAENTAIKANGESVLGMPSSAGAGGGGAGGSILLSAADYGDIRIEINGGVGGSVNRVDCNSTANSRGVGGGGSGGFLLTTNAMSWYDGLSDKIKKDGGVAGRISNATGGSCPPGYSTPGQDGIYRGNFQVQLRGFFRNHIMTPDTETCNGEEITIEASQPQGGNGSFTYSWESAPVGTETWTTISGKTDKDLTHTITQSIRVRRKVTSGGINDYSSPVTITAETVINTAIAPADTVLCWKESLTIRGNTPTGGGGGPYEIQWQELKNNTWVNIDQATALNLTVSLQAGGGDQTYRRLVTSAKSCVSEGNTSIIRVQPLITGNTITPDDQRVCEDIAQKLTGLEPTGGTGTSNNKYQWQIRTEGLDWTDLTGAVDIDCQPILNTPQIASANRYEERSYRRNVTSGVCQSQSNEVTVRFDRQSSASNIETPGDQVGGNALRFQFSEELNAEPPVIGSGIWLSADEKLSFSPPDNPSTTVSNLQLGVNTVIWTVSNGACVSEPDSVKIEVIDVTMPNGFSPNGDGINDCFRVVGGENAITGEITVLDRYNNVVFESKSFKGGSDLNNCSGWWDGRTSSGKELPAGTYFYQLILNGDKVYKGYVVLKKQ